MRCGAGEAVVAFTGARPAARRRAALDRRRPDSLNKTCPSGAVRPSVHGERLLNRSSDERVNSAVSTHIDCSSADVPVCSTSAADGAASRVTGRQSQRSTVSSAKFAHAENDTGHVSSSNPTRPNPSHRPIVSPNPLMTIGNPIAPGMAQPMAMSLNPT